MCSDFETVQLIAYVVTKLIINNSYLPQCHNEVSVGSDKNKKKSPINGNFPTYYALWTLLEP